MIRASVVAVKYSDEEDFMLYAMLCKPSAKPEGHSSSLALILLVAFLLWLLCR